MKIGNQTDRKYRYGYQGEFAEYEKDETEFNSFQARMYDPVIGRWMSVDPARQYASGYVGMGNNPVMGLDPDGRRKVYYNADGRWTGRTENNTFWHTLWHGNQKFVDDGFGNFHQVSEKFFWNSNQSINGARYTGEINVGEPITDIIFKSEFNFAINESGLTYRDVGVSGFKVDIASVNVYTYSREVGRNFSQNERIFNITNGSKLYDKNGNYVVKHSMNVETPLFDVSHTNRTILNKNLDIIETKMHKLSAGRPGKKTQASDEKISAGLFEDVGWSYGAIGVKASLFLGFEFKTR
ncbi:hypothetical protein EI427_17345 [Flammeovirga pectinis]|uniref:RHS repeat-associated core domain-containing protein n=1 Tax=Flammeovirga pectinis TaxID=2494373 RepID=A0A3S9P6U9_9BACT|nr:RHS repeat-associated core domain-containing protein [Flammeovirga pectinis]AZQ63926.1 hypothetical protein EI427_17345 [Flammeovirga pectinis]